MKKQINFGLFLGFLFIIWLFVNTLIVSQNQLKIQELKLNTEYKIVQKKFDIEQIKLSQPEYAIGERSIAGDSIPFIYDKKTGATFKFFSEEKNFGWTPFLYQWSGVAEFTPEDFYKRYINKLVQEKGKENN